MPSRNVSQISVATVRCATDMHPQILARVPSPSLHYTNCSTSAPSAKQRKRQNRKTERKADMTTMQDPIKPPTRPIPAVPPGPAASDALPPGECAAAIGLDWGDRSHSVALCVRGSNLVETFDIEHTAESLHAWLDSLRGRFGGQPVAVAVEASKGAIVAAMGEHPWLRIYPVHPATSRRFATAFTPSGAKDDVPDARILLEILRSHRDRLRLLVAHDPQTARLGLLNEARRTMVDRRTLFSNQLTSLLKGYYPQALELTGVKRHSKMALAFLERWPELDALQRARPQTVRGFYHRHNVRRPELVAKRLELIRTACPLTTDRALCGVGTIEMRALVAQIRLVQSHLADIEETMAAAFANHPEAPLFAGLPGAGAAMAPRLSVLTDRGRWRSAAEMQTYYGIAPVVERSGRRPSSSGPASASSTARGPEPTTASRRNTARGIRPSCAASPSSGCASSGAAGRTARPTTKADTSPVSKSAIQPSSPSSPQHEKTQKTGCAVSTQMLANPPQSDTTPDRSRTRGPRIADPLSL